MLLQFLWSLRNEPENRNYLWQLRDRFAEYPLVLERHRCWIVPELLETLAELGLGIATSTSPVSSFHRSVKPSAHSNSGIGYVRLHGRNYKKWFSPKADVCQRYDSSKTSLTGTVGRPNQEDHPKLAITTSSRTITIWAKQRRTPSSSRRFLESRLKPPAELVQAIPCFTNARSAESH